MTRHNQDIAKGLSEVTAAAESLKLRYGYRFIKRAFDIAFSMAMLVVFSLPMALIALAIRLTTPGPAIFIQRRVKGVDQFFNMYKFRSMRIDAEDCRERLLALNEKDGPVFKIKDDPRVTSIGRFIRRTSIDEFPQFVNVLKGEMSVVGPRPALPEEVEQYDEQSRLRLLVKPGITCIWQVMPNRDDVGFEEWMACDLEYIKTCSVLTDLKLIIKTIGAIFAAQGN